MSEQKDPAVKPEGGEPINLRVMGLPNWVSRTLTIGKQTQLKKLMQAYCDINDLLLEAVGFEFDGQMIREEDTATDLDMEEDDVIEAFPR